MTTTAQAIARIREIHAPLEAISMDARNTKPTKVCSGCGTDAGNWTRWPCPTIRALDDIDEPNT